MGGLKRRDSGLVRAAVLVPLHIAAGGEPRLTLIQRATGLHPHQGQVAFPGGRHDPARDPDLLATALREAEEEIGLAPDQVTLLGALPERRTASTNYLITPFVGRVAPSCVFRPDPDEVESIFSAPLSRFRDPQAREPLDWEFAGTVHRLACVRVGRHVVWGVTLDIIDDLLRSGLSRAD